MEIKPGVNGISSFITCVFFFHSAIKSNSRAGRITFSFFLKRNEKMCNNSYEWYLLMILDIEWNILWNWDNFRYLIVLLFFLSLLPISRKQWCIHNLYRSLSVWKIPRLLLPLLLLPLPYLDICCCCYCLWYSFFLAITQFVELCRIIFPTTSEVEPKCCFLPAKKRSEEKKTFVEWFTDRQRDFKPDRPFRNFRALKSGGQGISFSSGTSCDENFEVITGGTYSEWVCHDIFKCFCFLENLGKIKFAGVVYSAN